MYVFTRLVFSFFYYSKIGITKVWSSFWETLEQDDTAKRVTVEITAVCTINCLSLSVFDIYNLKCTDYITKISLYKYTWLWQLILFAAEMDLVLKTGILCVVVSFCAAQVGPRINPQINLLSTYPGFPISNGTRSVNSGIFHEFTTLTNMCYICHHPFTLYEIKDIYRYGK